MTMKTYTIALRCTGDENLQELYTTYQNGKFPKQYQQQETFGTLVPKLNEQTKKSLTSD